MDRKTYDYGNPRVLRQILDSAVAALTIGARSLRPEPGRAAELLFEVAAVLTWVDRRYIVGRLVAEAAAIDRDRAQTFTELGDKMLAKIAGEYSKGDKAAGPASALLH